MGAWISALALDGRSELAIHCRLEIDLAQKLASVSSFQLRVGWGSEMFLYIFIYKSYLYQAHLVILQSNVFKLAQTACNYS